MTFDERVHAVEQKGFTERQARFLTTVMLHAGVCVPRQYARFCGIVYGAKTRRFFDKLVRLRYASMYDCRPAGTTARGSTTSIGARCTRRSASSTPSSKTPIWCGWVPPRRNKPT